MTYSINTLNADRANLPASGVSRFAHELALVLGAALLGFWLIALLSHSLNDPAWSTTGNEGEVALGDVLGWMAQSPDIDVICAYAEGIRESERFIAALDLARRNRKPVVMLKVGRSELGGHAAKSHTASIAGDDAVTLADFAAEIAQQTSKPIGYQDLPQQDYRDALLGAGLPGFVADLLSDSDAGAAQGGLFDDSGTLGRLIGRPTTSMADVIAVTIAA